MKIHEAEEKEGKRTLTKGLRLGLSRKLDWRKVFNEKKVFRLREKRERLIYLRKHKIGSDLNIYIENTAR